MRHLRRLGKAAGVKIYVNGEPQETTVLNDNLNDTIRTTVPFKFGQRDTASPLDDAGVAGSADLRPRTQPAKSTALADVPRLAWLAGKPADKRTKAETQRTVSTGWLNDA